MSNNPTLHLPPVEAVEAEEVTPDEPARAAALVPALRQQDLLQLNTSQGLAGMNLGLRLAYAEQLIKSGLVPKHFNTPEKALLAFEQGEVLGLRPIEALSRLYVIDGKVSMYAELMRARAVRAGLRFQLLEEAVPVVDEAGTILDYRWTYEMLELLPDKTMLRYKNSKTWSWAQKTGLTSKDPWKKFTNNMFGHRITADLIRMYRPDVLMGFYTVDELSDSTSRVHYTIDQETHEIVPIG